MKWHWKCHITAFPGFYGRERRSKTKWGLMCPSVQSDGNKIHPGLRSQQRPRPGLLSFITVLCSHDTGEVLPLGAIIFVLLVEVNWSFFWFRSTGTTWMPEDKFNPKKLPITFTEVERFLRNGNISRSKIKVKLLQSICEHCLGRRSKCLVLSQQVCKFCVLLQSHLLMSCWWQGVLVQWPASWRSVGLLQNMNCRIRAEKVNWMTERFSSFNDWVVCLFLEGGAGVKKSCWQKLGFSSIDWKCLICLLCSS